MEVFIPLHLFDNLSYHYPLRLSLLIHKLLIIYQNQKWFPVRGKTDILHYCETE